MDIQRFNTGKSAESEAAARTPWKTSCVNDCMSSKSSEHDMSRSEVKVCTANILCIALQLAKPLEMIA